MIDVLVSRGYGTYVEIIEEFSPEEIERFYGAALAGFHRENREHATATRLAQHADQKGWKEYSDSVDRAVRGLFGKAPGGRNAEKRGKQDVDGFFSQLGKLPSKGSKIRDGKQVSGKAAIPIRKQGTRRRIDP